MAKLIAFDLDGTLIDSRHDLAGAVNYMRASLGLEPLETERLVKFLGNGISSLVYRSIADADVDFDTALERTKNFYADHLVESTRLYPGVAATLQDLCSRGIKLAVVTNKNSGYSRRILTALGVADFFSDIIGGDGDYPLKPEPDALNALREKYALSTEDCWMVGDHYTDLEAGRRAGFRRIMVTYGFGEEQNETPDYTASSFNEAAAIISGF